MILDAIRWAAVVLFCLLWFGAVVVGFLWLLDSARDVWQERGH